MFLHCQNEVIEVGLRRNCYETRRSLYKEEAKAARPTMEDLMEDMMMRERGFSNLTSQNFVVLQDSCLCTVFEVTERPITLPLRFSDSLAFAITGDEPVSLSRLVPRQIDLFTHYIANVRSARFVVTSQKR